MLCRPGVLKRQWQRQQLDVNCPCMRSTPSCQLVADLFLAHAILLRYLLGSQIRTVPGLSRPVSTSSGRIKVAMPESFPKQTWDKHLARASRCIRVHERERKLLGEICCIDSFLYFTG